VWALKNGEPLLSLHFLLSLKAVAAFLEGSGGGESRSTAVDPIAPSAIAQITKKASPIELGALLEYSLELTV